MAFLVLRANFNLNKLECSYRYSRHLFHCLRKGFHIGPPLHTSGSSDGDVSEPSREPFQFSCGKYAKLANGCAVVEHKGTAVMATAIGQACQSSDVPLTVHYLQKSAAASRIPTNFLRRELGQSDTEIVISRVIDRSIRPLFLKNTAIETQVICSPLALDGNSLPDVLAINAASAALACSDIPWNGPVAAVRIGLVDNVPVMNPSKHELADSSVNIILTAMRNNLVVMIEGSCDNVLVNDFQKCMRQGLKHCRATLKLIEDLCESNGKEKRKFDDQRWTAEATAIFEAHSDALSKQLKEIYLDRSLSKLSRDDKIGEILSSFSRTVLEQQPGVGKNQIEDYFFSLQKDVYTEIVFEDVRCDGRTLNQMRDIACESGLYEALHGSSLFQRGQTQVFCTVSLDSPSSSLKSDNISFLNSGVKEKNFFVHYEFPAFATGNIGRPGRPNRREIGHGMLAENSLKCMIPESFPYTIRLSAQVLESNGSSSMATVSGGTIALLDAGVPLNNPVVGVAMGLFAKWENDELSDYRILTDLMGMEDYLGDMDFKIAGTKTGITGLQLDIKIPGLPLKIVYEAITEAKKSFSTILNAVHSTISQPREESKSNWPVMKIITVAPQNRGKFIGFGGMNIKNLEIDLGIEVTELEPGKYSIFARNQSIMDETLQRIEDIFNAQKEPDLEFGGIYTATVVEMRDNGLLVTLYPDMKPTLVPISQLDVRKIQHPSALGLDVGSEFNVKYFGRDPITGAMRLSRRALQVTEDSTARNLVGKPGS